MFFQTGPTNGGGYRFYRGTSELFTILNNGNVGIGTTNPGGQLSIFDTNNSRAYQMSFGYETTETFRLGNNNATGKFTFTQLTNNNGFRFTSSAPNATGIIFDINTSQLAVNGDTGNVLINTTTDVGAKLYVNGSIAAVGGITIRESGSGILSLVRQNSGYAASTYYYENASLYWNVGMNGGTYSWRVDDPNYGINNKLVVSQGNDWGVGIGTDSPTRRFQVVGTTRHERVYAYANNLFQFANDIPQNELWLHLGTQAAFTTDKIYYRVNTNTSEEEGEIIVKNTCATANIEWFRNSYNVMVTAVKARMQGGCGACEIFIRVRYGSNYLGANTTVQWQVYSGTDSGFTTVNAVATPGTGTNEANIASTDGYMVSTSNNQSVGSRLGVNTTSPASRVHAVEASSGISARTDLGGTIIAEGSTRAGLYILTAGTAAGSYGSIWWGNGNTNTDAYISVSNDTRAMDFGTADGFAMRITSSRNVLIGTTTDSGNKLEVAGTLRATTGIFSIEAGFPLQVYQTNATNTTTAIIRQTTSGGNGNQDIGLVVDIQGAADNDRIVNFRYYDGTNYNSRFVVQRGGNVGIGTTLPTSKLYIEGGSADWNETTPGTSVGTIHLDPGVITDNFGNAITFGASDTGGGETAQAGIYVRSDGNYGTKMYFATCDSYIVGSVTRMLITHNGNVLIGTTTDSGYKLRVNGTSYFDAPILCYTGNGFITALTNDGVGSNFGFGYSFLINNTGHEIGRIAGQYEDSASGGTGGVGIYTRQAGTLNQRLVVSGAGTVQVNNNASSGVASTNFIAYAYDSDSFFKLGNNTNNSLDIQLTRSDTDTMFSVNGHTGFAYFAGKVRIGTTTASGYKMAISSGQEIGLRIDTDANYAAINIGGTGAILVDAPGVTGGRFALRDNGNVQIGTTTDAGYKLDVAGTFRASTSGSVARIETSTNATEVLQIYNSGGDSGSVQGVTHLGINFFSVGTNSPVRITAFQESNSGYRGGMYFSTRNANSDSAPSEAMRISPDQLVGIGTSGTTAADYRLTVDSTGVDYAIYSFGSTHVDNGALGVGVVPSATIGRIDASNDIVAYSSSDKRLKENITPIANALDKVKALTGVEFDWKPEHKDAHGYEGHDTGVIAQEVKEVMPSAVRENETGFLAVRYEKLIGLLIEAVKEQQAEIDELKKLIK
jgi:hypothetical protein